jgi:hypothetical protein
MHDAAPIRAGARSIFAAALFGAATPAGAVVKGTSSSLGSYTVRLVGNGYCSGGVIARRTVVTAAHCARGMRVLAGGSSFRVASISRSAVLDDGRHVNVSGDAAILKLTSPLPSGIGAAPVGDTFTIAGYGTSDERYHAYVLSTLAAGKFGGELLSDSAE